jgi:hypothetical protein
MDTPPTAVPRRMASSDGWRLFIRHSIRPYAVKKRYPAAAVPREPPPGDCWNRPITSYLR